MVEAAKEIASMWTEMAQLLRSKFCILTIKFHGWLILCNYFCRKEYIVKEKQFKEDIVDLAKSINKESQGVMKIATKVAEVCTDKILKKVLYSIHI